ncbi:aspartate/glutamate racemase family protein [Geobacter sp. SVR]|uniref:aspartate/glutamate racemase family protein n=1 Tax=Geobacter sp. SVR TaxID=2495594 RepID=UPI00143EF902|nr:aspartate/glutamate racemase family protein [Geobacter sp. SVR]BCS54415.1 hypothetical protein GSVR_27230 [Geobacter sp. SVR]GCF87646.1 hypothetical protein GSbR_42460 [Geobacter sp. SVR]
MPDDQDQQFIQEKLVTEIEKGIMKEDTRSSLLSIIEGMRERDGIEAAILGCTELPLIFADNDANISLLNTTALHVEEICKYCLG